MSRFPHVRRDVPTSQVATVAEEVELRGLDGHGTTHAADLPTSAHVWGHLAAPAGVDDDLDEEEPVKREKCLMVDPDGDRLMPGRCKRPIDHEPPCDWRAAHGAYLDGGRREQLRERDTPSGVLPVRVPGAALGDAQGSSGVEGPARAARAAESNVEREVLETWAV